MDAVGIKKRGRIDMYICTHRSQPTNETNKIFHMDDVIYVPNGYFKHCVRTENNDTKGLREKVCESCRERKKNVATKHTA